MRLSVAFGSVCAAALLCTAGAQSPFGIGPARGQDVAYKCMPLQYIPFPGPSEQTHVSATGVEGHAVGLYASVPPDGVFFKGRPITIALSAVNAGKTPATFSFRTAQRYDVIIWDDDCREVWRWSAGRMFAQVVQLVTIQPRASLVYKITWDQRDRAGHQVRTGAYETQVLFLGGGALGRGPVVLPPLKFAVR